VTELDEAEMQCLADITERIIKIQRNTSHTFQSYIIRNEISNLFFEILNIRRKKKKNQMSLDKSEYKEDIARKFISLLLQYCKERHEVSFYAEKMYMTSTREIPS
jgi:hypothetical protein